AQLSEEVDELASAFVAAGVDRGYRVVYQLYNTPEFVIVYLATQRIGAISVPINFRLSPRETAFILQDSDPRVYIYAQKAASIAEAALTSWKGRPAAVVAVPRRTGATAAAEASGAEPGTPASGDEPLKSTTYD